MTTMRRKERDIGPPLGNTIPKLQGRFLVAFLIADLWERLENFTQNAEASMSTRTHFMAAPQVLATQDNLIVRERPQSLHGWLAQRAVAHDSPCPCQILPRHQKEERARQKTGYFSYLIWQQNTHQQGSPTQLTQGCSAMGTKQKQPCYRTAVFVNV